jgi:nucleoside-diphosphate-sugar epimerase
VSETAPANPVTGYGLAKDEARKLVVQCCEASGLRHLWFRLFSLYGPGETEPWLIPSLVHALLKGEAFPLTPCEQVRDYLYVDDAAAAFLAAVLHHDVSGVFNVASGVGVTLRDVVTQVAHQVRPGASLGFGALPYRGDQPRTLVADVSKFRAATGWAPKVDLESGIRETVKFLLHEQQVSD